MGLFDKIFGRNKHFNGKSCECCGKPSTTGVNLAQKKDDRPQIKYFCQECMYNGEAAKIVNRDRKPPEKRTVEQLYEEVLNN